VLHSPAVVVPPYPLACILKIERALLPMADEIQKQILETLQRIDARTASLETTLNEVSIAVAALTVGQRDLKESINIIEHDISGVKLRVERIERHTGLVKA